MQYIAHMMLEKGTSGHNTHSLNFLGLKDIDSLPMSELSLVLLISTTYIAINNESHSTTT